MMFRPVTLILLFHSLTSAAADTSVELTIAQGAVRCNALSTGVRECLGIPFAKPPTGLLRWRPPQDLPGPLSQHGTFNATGFGPSCPQSAGQLLDASAISEDCLTLNVWSPPAPATGAKPTAILVWFYGGGFTQGGSSDYNGSVLAAKHGVTVVTANYRVGALGFAAIPWNGQGGVGNFGLMDQQSTLRWVQREADNFGADRKRVTIFGQSAGADSVDAHVLLESSHGLFARAIMQSGDVDGADPLNFSMSVTDDFAQRLGCNRADVRLSCLRSKNVSTILAAQGPASGPSTPGNPALECATAKGCRSFRATADGVFLRDTAFELTRRGMINKDVDIIAGTNTDDGSLFAVGYYDTVNASRYTELLTATLMKLERLKNRFHLYPGELQRALQLYPPSSTRLPIGQQTQENVASLSKVLTNGFACGTRLIANATQQAGRRAWLYRFDYNATWQRPCYNTWGKEYGNATHTAELSFVFGLPLYVFGPPTDATSCSFTADEDAFADRIGSLWAGFAKDGVPPESASWPQWDATTDLDLVLSLEPRVEKAWRADVCRFWLQDAFEQPQSIIV